MTSQAISRRTLIGSAAAAATFGLAPARAQKASNWPDRQVRLIVPYPAGGSTDVLFRIIAERLKDKLGQSVVVENKPGASGNIGIDVRSPRARRTATRSAARPSGISRSTSS